GKTILINDIGDAAGTAGAYYLRRTDGSPAVKLGEGQGIDLSADGRWVLARAPERGLALIPTGTGSPIPIAIEPLENPGNTVFSPDGKRLLLSATEGGGKRRVYIRDLPSGKPRAITDKAYFVTRDGVSPDGRWAAAWGEYTEDLFLLPIDGGEPRTVANTKDLDFIRWSGDGKFIFGVVSGSIPAHVVRVEVATGKRESWKDLAPAEPAGLIAIGPVFLTPDGKGYVYGYGRAATSDLYLIEGLK
ncbi:MAG: TolB family protein, partial [Syntrophomonadaceae bacterium]